MATKKKASKNSLVENINRRKRTGKSRPKARSTVAPDAYEAMQKGWPKKAKKAKAKTATKKARAKTAAKKAKAKTTAKKVAKKARPRR